MPQAVAEIAEPEELLVSVPVISEPVEFWFVWTKKGRVPRFAHHTQESAMDEAIRLARKRPDCKFIVLKATHKFRAFAAPIVPLVEG
jgi:hypothetical protein